MCEEAAHEIIVFLGQLAYTRSFLHYTVCLCSEEAFVQASVWFVQASRTTTLHLKILLVAEKLSL